MAALHDMSQSDKMGLTMIFYFFKALIHILQLSYYLCDYKHRYIKQSHYAKSTYIWRLIYSSFFQML